ncbi:hypothetical protein L484_005245 [Morus notabilis]|uniref:MORF/ORRM1/DAG-like MORF domain-containing protein n=1 Tax=Morus notabilis TaxID=981085 RepID=W9SAT4_9ROSA|nr:uncharacterized protein LOC21388721 [Morus notabilis]EXC23295.1 hypothetical protein L484_005245 [Morus notabilis]
MAFVSALRRTSSSLLRKSLSLSSYPLSSSSSSSTSFFRISSRHRFFIALLNQLVPDSARPPLRFCTTTASPPSRDDPIWGNPTEEVDETITIDGCDFEHWLVIMRFPEDPKPSEDEMVDTYIKTLAAVVGSEEEAKKKIYSVSTTTFTGFGALVSRDLSQNLKGLPGVLWVLPDSYLDVPNKDYGGDLLVDGKVVPRPEYRFGEQELGDTVEYSIKDLEESEECEENKKGTEELEGSFIERLRERIKNVEESSLEDSEGPAGVTKGRPTKNVEILTEGVNVALEGRPPMFDTLKETMKTMERGPSHENLEATAAPFDRLREKLLIEPAQQCKSKELERRHPMFDMLKETMKTMEREPSHENLEETADEEESAAPFDRLREKILTEPAQQSKSKELEGRVEESEDMDKTAALFGRLREKMKNRKIEPVGSSGEHYDSPDIWSDEYYEKAEEPQKKLTKEQLDALTVQMQEFEREVLQRKDENKDG